MRSQEAPSVSVIHRRLLAGYAVFAPVAWCHDARDGYAYEYTNDVEIERAHAAIKAIVEQTRKRMRPIAKPCPFTLCGSWAAARSAAKTIVTGRA